MADFVAVLRKTIGTLGDNTPEMREKVYEKARSTIEAKLRAIDPPPPPAVIDRQRKALEDAIAVVRADYDAPDAGDGDELEDVFATLKSMGDVKPPSPLSPRPAAPAPAQAFPAAPAVTAPPRPAPVAPAPVAPAAVSATPVRRPDPVLDIGEDEAAAPPDDFVAAPAPVAPRAHAPAAKARPAAKRRTGSVAALAALLLLVAGGSYALWLNRDDLFGGSSPVAEAPGEEGATTAEELSAPPPDEEAPAEAVAAVPAEPAQESPAPVAPTAPTVPAAPTEEPKFTQRLLADGTEVDEGPAGGPRTIGEGTSVASAAQVAQPGAVEQTPPAVEPAAPAAQQPAEPATPAVAVGQRAIFYEERTSAAQGSAEMGSIVWSVVQESPGGDLPPEPAIRAEATVPGKDVQLRMTIRRNGDQTLPASHIVEMIFLTPDGFEGGAIANVSRIAFKETEQAAGNALIGIPAKIADGFFLIALGDTPAEIEANLALLRRQSWIDIPIVYQTGRRALLTLEKGIPGERVFEEAVRAWTEASSG